MNRYTPFWILVQLIFTAPAWSDDCAPVRLDSPGGSMEHVRGRGQEFGTCYAETASELFDAWRFSHGEENWADASSALELALRYSFKNSSDGFDQGGYIESALNLIKDIGTCSEKTIDEKIKNLTSKQYAILVAELQEKHRESFDRRRLRTVPPASRMDGYAALADQQRRSIDYVSFQLENYLLLEDLRALVDVPAENNPTITQTKPKLFEQAAALRCEDHDRMLAPEAFDVVSRSDSRRRASFKAELRKMIDSNLSQALASAQPLAISYCGYLLTEGRQFSVRKPRAGTDECGNHASVILGRRTDPNSGRCQYLVLNSWDMSQAASTYHSDWDVTPSGYHLWVDRSAIEEVAHGYTFLRPAGYR